MEPQQLVQRRVMALAVVPLAIVTLLGVMLLLPPEQGSPEIRAVIAVVGLLVAVSWTVAMAIGIVRSVGDNDTEDLGRLDRRRQEDQPAASDRADNQASPVDDGDGVEGGPGLLGPGSGDYDPVGLPLVDRPAVPNRRIDVVGVAPDMVLTRARQIQDLLDVQVDRLDRMEQGEEVPGSLSDLFHVDHLAIRAWRLAADLLVLAESGPPDYQGAPVKLETVTRLALGQAEHYRRVEILGLGDDELPTGAARDLAQLVAILLDAISGPDPDGTVTVQVEGVVGPDLPPAVPSTDTGFNLVLDGGSLSSEDRDAWNSALDSPPSVGRTDAEVDRVVAGRLARRLGCQVTVVPTDDPSSNEPWTTIGLGDELSSDDGTTTPVMVRIEVPRNPGEARSTRHSVNGGHDASSPRPNSVLEQLMGVAAAPAGLPAGRTTSEPKANESAYSLDSLLPPQSETSIGGDRQEADGDESGDVDGFVPGLAIENPTGGTDGDRSGGHHGFEPDDGGAEDRRADLGGNDPRILSALSLPIQPGPDYTPPPPVRADPDGMPTPRPGLLRDALPSGPALDLGIDSLLGDDAPADRPVDGPGVPGSSDHGLGPVPTTGQPTWQPQAAGPEALLPPTPAPTPPEDPTPPTAAHPTQPTAAEPTQPVAAHPTQPVAAEPTQPPAPVNAGWAVGAQFEAVLPTGSNGSAPAEVGGDQDMAVARAEALRERLSSFRSGVGAGREAGRGIESAAVETIGPESASDALDLSWPTFDERPPAPGSGGT